MIQFHQQRRGFTIIEMSLVLVIISALVGGILVGQHLIAVAEVNKFISSYSAIKGAVSQFKEKYKALPGDLYTPNRFMPGVVSGGDGSGYIEGYTGGTLYAYGEPNFFWQMLGASGILPTTYFCSSCSPGLNATGGVTVTVDSTNMDMAYLRAPIGPITNRWVVYGENFKNFFQVIDLYQNVYNGAGNYTHKSGITPMQALSIDQKIDDGAPNTGTIIAVDNGAADVTAVTTSTMDRAAQSGTASQNYCLFTGGTTYNITGSTANMRTCELRLDME